MADLTSEIFNGTPEAMDEEDLQRLNAVDQSTEYGPPDQPPEGTEQSDPTSQESQPQQQAASTEAKPKEEKEEQTSIFDEGVDAGDAARTVSEAALAIPTGALDFGVEVLNLIPGVNANKLPKFHNNTATVIREIFSVIGPTIGLTATGVGAGTAAANVASKAGKLKILADPLFKKLATMGLSTGVGVGVSFSSLQDTNAVIANAMINNFFILIFLFI